MGSYTPAEVQSAYPKAPADYPNIFQMEPMCVCVCVCVCVCD